MALVVVKNLLASAADLRDVGSIPGLGRPPAGGNGNPVQYSCLENPIDRGAWRATVHGIAELDTTEHTQHRDSYSSICLNDCINTLCSWSQ